MFIFWWDLFMLPTLVDWVNLVSSPLAVDSVHTWQQMNLSIYLEMQEVVKLVQVFFVNSARVHGYPLWMFLDVSEWILEKTAENQVMMTKHVRGEYKKFVELGRHWWQLSWHFEILQSVVSLWRFELESFAFRLRVCQLSLFVKEMLQVVVQYHISAHLLQKKENRYMVHGISKLGWDIWMCFSLW